ncbi:MAG TPA: hypothetical protein VGF65_16340 [Mycobacterium sp.]|jgi:5-methylcytosine-specific restriction endonuclease McrA
MYSWDNLQAMTKQCHDRKTAAHDGGFGNPLRIREPSTADPVKASEGRVSVRVRTDGPSRK